MLKANDDTPTFNLKAVVNETGLKPDTLRAWERRYGVPTPDRTAGGHRIYSQQDVETIKWLIARREEGLSISHAVNLWQELISQGQDPLASDSAFATEPEPSPPVDGDFLTRFRERWLQACLEFDEQQAQQLLAQAFAQFPLETVCFELLQKGLHDVGQAWYEGKATVQQEHFASALAIRQLESLLTSAPTPTRPQRILVACPPHERHTFSGLLLTLLLRRRGWEVVYLGADVPVEKLSSQIESIQAQLVILTAQTLHTASTTLDMAERLQQQQVPLAFGGAVFNALDGAREHIPGHFLGETLEAAPRTIEKLLQSPMRIQKAKTAAPGHRLALDEYRQHRAAIEAQLWQLLQPEKEIHDYLDTANKEFGDNIVAALHLGNLDLIDANMEWIEGLLANLDFRVPAALVNTYLNAYTKAAEIHLDAQKAKPLLEWLKTKADDTAQNGS